MRIGGRQLRKLDPATWRDPDQIASDRSLHDLLDDQTHLSATIVILRELPDVYEYYVLGDSTIVFDLAGGLAARSDKRLRAVATAERERVRALGSDAPKRDAAILDLLKAKRAQRNVRGGYWIASTNPDAAARGLQGHISHSNLRRAALLSDGAAAAVDCYDLMDWRSVLDMIEKNGPQAIIRAARDAENSDPHAERWPRNKVHDDATVIFCSPQSADKR